MDKKKRIIELYETVQVVEVHPSYQQIAKKVKCSKAYVFSVIREYKAQKKAFGL